MTKYKPAMYFDKIEDSKVCCSLCPHNCVIKPGCEGICGVRKNIDGSLFSLNYGKVTSMSLDPIEKKPLKMFRKGSMILSAGTFGCNLKCPFCQNWSIAHHKPETVEVTPSELVEKAEQAVKYGNIGIAYTYNEPSIWYEYVCDTCKLARERGLVNVLVTNGFIGEKPLKDILPYIDAMNIDVKGFSQKFYNKICKANLNNVKKTVEISAAKCHIEVTYLMIPGLNDGMEEIAQLAGWLSDISPDIPLHLSRYFPNYNMDDRPPTPIDTLISAKKTAMEYLNYVFIGNI